MSALASRLFALSATVRVPSTQQTHCYPNLHQPFTHAGNSLQTHSISVRQRSHIRSNCMPRACILPPMGFIGMGAVLRRGFKKVAIQAWCWECWIVGLWAC